MRLIDADELIELYDGLSVPIAVVRQNIEDAPTIDAEPVRHGYWIPWLNAKDEFGRQFTAIHMCSECKTANHYYPTDYCPDCGAKMDGKENNND